MMGQALRGEPCRSRLCRALRRTLATTESTGYRYGTGRENAKIWMRVGFGRLSREDREAQRRRALY